VYGVQLYQLRAVLSLSICLLVVCVVDVLLYRVIAVNAAALVPSCEYESDMS